MKLLHIVGRQNNGKTTLIEELITELTNRGLKVGSIKHSSHTHELDAPGKDSFRHRKAGGNPASIICPELMAVYIPLEASTDPFKALLPHYDKSDLVIVEGYIDREGRKIEVWRKDMNQTPLAEERNDIEYIITDDEADSRTPTLPRSNIALLADKIQELVDVKSS